jgi:hypothetical protein
MAEDPVKEYLRRIGKRGGKQAAKNMTPEARRIRAKTASDAAARARSKRAAKKKMASASTKSRKAEKV